ncbi:hypothetical protein P8917_05935 [Bacillus atrophaeus]|nr:hypothetical protein [Bacillus atrophaeus]MCY8498303.1 hypothetical protein [Bacillus atrophaeus]MCY8811981.1 hypothetical protein [Bacillus atrophaeus]MCY8820914.1 hypothetical protein [Bacillus atrophaeus]MCY8827881.1 hypothetical protein [Bacillus atrophaeus]MCY8831934.1 hypothetical protein [Bacillus atrophaeus]
MTEVSNKLGFSNPYYFSRVFKCPRLCT